MTAISGWILDAYPSGDKMVFWIKRENGRTFRLEDDWSHSIYVAGSKEDLAPLANDIAVKSYEFVQKYEKVTDGAKSEVLKLTLADSAQAEALGKRIMLSGRYGQYRLYNVDLLPAQAYFYEHNLFPLAFCNVAASKGKVLTCADDVWSIDYRLPEFKTIHLDIKPKKQGRLPKFSDPIESITIKDGDDVHEIGGGDDEVQLLFRLHEEMTGIDPDFVFTKDGDAFIFPYLAERAKVNGCQSLLALGRDTERQTRKPGKDGTTYFSYGRIHYRPPSAQLYGRVHIDTCNSFILDESGMQGLFEVARICRMPLHKASRASIGRCMSSLQCYYATTGDILIPWKPDHAEHFKSYSELFVADRGGMIFEPRIGVHEHVAEFDFASLYPSIMSKKNLSGETVLCSCCPESRLRVPELGWHICEKRTGIVPKSLEILLKKRALYKQRPKSPETTTDTKKIYDARQNALKWILVTSFGYLGFNNAKFGRIDAHIATCAFDRQILMQAVRVSEKQGFRVLHGIVDSLWVYRRGATKDDFMGLKDAIERETDFTISFEGVYKWVAFVHSKQNDLVPVPNRYFGVFEDGKLKVRGIEVRRRDNPPFFDKVQSELLRIMASGNSVAEVRALMPTIKDVFYKYVRQLREGKVPIEDLVFTKQTSKDADDYTANSTEVAALRQLGKEGMHMHAGEVLQYVITDFYNKRADERSTPVELVDKSTRYDARRYIELLAQMCNSVTMPFGYVLEPVDGVAGSL